MIRRPMIAVFLSLVAGILFRYHEIPVWLFFAVYLCTLTGLLSAFAYDKIDISRFCRPSAYGGALFVVGLIPVMFLTGYIREAGFDKKIERERTPYIELYDKGTEKVVIEGNIKKIIKEENRYKIEIRDCSIRSEYEKESVNAGGALVYINSSNVKDDIYPGERVKFYGAFRPYLESSNPGEFDQAEYNIRNRLYASVFASSLWVIDEKRDTIRMLTDDIKAGMNGVLSSLYDEDNAGILSSMFTGSRELLSDDMKELFRNAGISHILAISGLHISFFCFGILRILEKIKLDIHKSRLVTACFTVIFVAFGGAGASAVRAGIMSLILLLSKSIRRRYDMLSGLCTAGLVILLLFPHDIFNPAFLLSFSAVVGISCSSETGLNYASGMFITLFTLPFVLYFYYETSLIGILVNVVVIPLSSLIMTTGFLSVMLGYVALPLGGMAAGITSLMISVVKLSSKVFGALPFSYACTGRPQPVRIVLYYCLLYFAVRLLCIAKENIENEAYRLYTEGIPLWKKHWVILLFYEIRGKYRKNALRAACSVLFVFLGTVLLFLKNNVREMAFLSVGQGDCFCFTDVDLCIVNDCGSSDRGSVGKYVLTPYLKINGRTVIDIVIVSHTDSDHINGIKEILDEMPVFRNDLWQKALYSGKISVKTLVLPKVKEKSDAYIALEDAAKSKNVNIIYAEEGYVLEHENGSGRMTCFESNDSFVRLTCLAPSDAVTSENGTSLCFLLETGKTEVMLVGDADISELDAVLDSLKKAKMSFGDGRTVIIKAGHHGSRTSANEAFIAYLKPDIAVISCGKNNSYGHPHRETLELLESYGVSVHRTDRDGAMEVPK